MERPATTAAAIAGARGAEIASDGEEDVGQEEGIAQVVEGGDAEDDIADGTDAHEAEGIEEGIVIGVIKTALSMGVTDVRKIAQIIEQQTKLTYSEALDFIRNHKDL